MSDHYISSLIESFRKDWEAAHAADRAAWEAKEKALTSIIIEFLAADQTIRHQNVGRADCKQCRVVAKASKLLNTPAAGGKEE